MPRYAAPKVELGINHKGEKVWRASCEKHEYVVECSLLQNASDALLAHEVHVHGRTIRPSEWSLSMAHRI